MAPGFAPTRRGWSSRGARGQALRRSVRRGLTRCDEGSRGRGGGLSQEPPLPRQPADPSRGVGEDSPDAARAQVGPGDAGHLRAPVAGLRRPDPRGDRLCSRSVCGLHADRAVCNLTFDQVRALAGDEPACKPGSVPRPRHRDRGDGHPSTTAVADRLQRPTRVLGRAALERTLSGFAPGGVYRAGPVTGAAGGLLHHRFTLAVPELTLERGGLFSVALSRGSPRVAVGHHLALWSPDFPRRPRPGGHVRRDRPAGSSADSLSVRH